MSAVVLLIFSADPVAVNESPKVVKLSVNFPASISVEEQIDEFVTSFSPEVPDPATVAQNIPAPPVWPVIPPSNRTEAVIPNVLSNFA